MRAIESVLIAFAIMLVGAGVMFAAIVLLDWWGGVGIGAAIVLAFLIATTVTTFLAEIVAYYRERFVEREDWEDRQ